MKLLENSWLFYYLVFCHIFGIILFLYGFLPVPDKSAEFADGKIALPTDLNGIA